MARHTSRTIVVPHWQGRLNTGQNVQQFAHGRLRVRRETTDAESHTPFAKLMTRSRDLKLKRICLVVIVSKYYFLLCEAERMYKAPAGISLNSQPSDRGRTLRKEDSF